jgi:TonB-dependent starch-binding outer membrane protein SusC
MRQIKIRRMMKTLLWAIISVFFSFTQSAAQNTSSRIIKGKVTASVSQASIPGATVSIKGTQNSVSAGDAGEFSIYAQTGNILVISYVGYKTKEIKVGDTQSTINIGLTQDYSNLQDVVVVGYGKTKKSDLSSAVGTISNSELSKTINVTLDEALQGKAANVYVSQTSGQPGAGSSVIIRGVSTLTGNYQPLYVIDGVQIRPSTPTGGAYNQPPGFANELAGINPDDIENISVLEGAAATSIYGAAGSNGVLMITTKHGKAGQTKVSASSLLTVQERPSERPVMNLQQYALYIQKLQALGLVGTEPAELGDPTLLGPGTDWQAALFRNTLLQKHSLAISGGSEKSTFYLSADYLSQDGVALGSGFQRGSLRLNLDNQANKWLKFGINLSTFATKEKVNTTNGNLINIAISQNPTIPVKNPDGSFGGPQAAQAQYSQTNPVALALINNNYNTSFGGIGNLYVDITPIKGLLWHTEVNGNYTFTNNYTFNPFYSLGAFQGNATSGSRGSGNNYWTSLNTRVQYDFSIQKHSITAMVGHEATYYAYQGLSATGLRYSTSSVQELSVADPLSPPGTSYKGWGSGESYFGRLNYIYDNKYIAQFVIRRDGSSNFGANNHFGTFPAVSVAWKISEEKFMKSLTFINDLKLRAEYGVSGNTGNNGTAIYSNLYAAPTVWGGGFLPANFPNPNLKWEQDKSKNIGLDLHMFNNRVEVIADAYIKNISNLILIQPHSGVLGGSLSGGYGGLISWSEQNVGGMQNRGIGITINTVNISTKDFQWKTGGNFSIDRNKITNLTTPILTQYYSSTNNSQAEFLTEVGQPLGMITGYIAEGIFQNYKDIADHAIQTSNGVLTIDPTQGSWVGDVKFKDISGPKGKPDGIIDNNDRTIIGNPWPKFTYNFNTSFSYKGFDLNLFFTGVYGNKLLNLTRYQNEMPLGTGPYSNHYRSAANFAVPSSLDIADALSATLLNPSTTIYRPTPTDPNGNVRLSQWDVENGSYLKLKNVRLSYRVPSKYVSYTHVLRGVTVVAQVQNVFTITKYTGFDPEVGMYNYKGVTNIVGMDEGRYPVTRSYSISLALDF